MWDRLALGYYFDQVLKCFCLDSFLLMIWIVYCESNFQIKHYHVTKVFAERDKIGSLYDRNVEFLTF